MASVWRDIGVALLGALSGALAGELVKPLFAERAFDVQVKVMDADLTDGPVVGATVNLGVPNISEALTIAGGVASFHIDKDLNGVHGKLLVSKGGYKSIVSDLLIKPSKEYVWIWLPQQSVLASQNAPTGSNYSKRRERK